MVPKPDPYDGSFDGFDIWWCSCQSYIADANITDEVDKIRVVLTSMKKELGPPIGSGKMNAPITMALETSVGETLRLPSNRSSTTPTSDRRQSTN